MKILLIYACSLLLTLTPVSLNAQSDNDQDEYHEDIVRFSQSELDEFGIELSTAGSGTLLIEIRVPGEVVANYDMVVKVAA